MLISTKAFRCHMIFVSEQSLRHWDTSTLRFVAQANLFLFVGLSPGFDSDVAVLVSKAESTFHFCNKLFC